MARICGPHYALMLDLSAAMHQPSVVRLGYGVLGEAQLMPVAPFRSDVIDDEGFAYAVHGPFLEAMPGLIAGHEDQSSINARRGAAHMGVMIGIDIGSPVAALRFAIEIDQHGKFLDTDIGMRFQPETVAVLAVLDAQRGAAQVCAGGGLQGIQCLPRLEDPREDIHHGVTVAILRSEMDAAVVVGLTSALSIIDVRRRDGQAGDGIHHRIGQAVVQQPMRIWSVGTGTVSQAGEQAHRCVALVKHPGELRSKDAEQGDRISLCLKISYRNAKPLPNL